MRLRIQPKPVFILVLLGLTMAAWPARADEQDDQYLSVYNLVARADELNASGQADKALAKYREAQRALVTLQRTYPTWNVKVVTFRQNYIAEKVAALTQKTSAPATNAATGGSRAAPETKTAGSASTPQVRLLEAGAEPRNVLRLHPKPGDKQNLSMTMKIAMDTRMGDMPGQAMKMPAMNMTLEVTVKSITTEGDISYEMVMGEATIAEEPGTLPQVAQAMKSALANLKGLSGTGTISSRGVSKGIDFKAPAGADPQASQMFDQAKGSFATLAVPFPEEAIGPGGKWEVKTTLKSQGMTIEQTANYQLLTVEGERLTARCTIAQHAANQKIQNPAMPGLALDLTKMTANGTGELTSDLGQLLPSAGTMDLHSDVSMGMNMGGKKQNMETKIDLNLRLEAK